MTAPGLNFFSIISYINLIFILIVGVTVFSGSVTEEKSGNNLNLLLLTGLTPLSILASKATSKLLEGLILLCIQVPFTFLAVTMGGVSLGQILVVYLVLVSFLFYVSNIGMLASAMCRTAQSASTLTFASFLPLMLAIIPWKSSVITVNPFFVLHWVLNGGSWLMITISIITYYALGGLVFYLAVFVFDYIMKKHPTPPAPTRIVSHKKEARFFQIERPTKNAIAWKGFFFTTSGRFGVIIRVLIFIGLLILPLLLEWFTDDQYEWWAIGAYYIASGCLVLLADIGMYVSKVLQDEVKWKTLQALMLLPMSHTQLMISMLKGMVPNIIPGLIYLMIGIALNHEILFDWPFWVVVFGIVYYSPVFLLSTLYSALKDRSKRSYGLAALFFFSFIIWPFLALLPLYSVPALSYSLKKRLNEVASE